MHSLALECVFALPTRYMRGAVQRLEAHQVRVREIMSQWDLEGFPGYGVPGYAREGERGGTGGRGAVLMRDAGTGGVTNEDVTRPATTDPRPWLAYVPFTDRVAGDSMLDGEGEEGAEGITRLGSSDGQRGAEEVMEEAGERVKSMRRLVRKMEEQMAGTEGGGGKEWGGGRSGEDVSEETDSEDVMMRTLRGEDWKWQGRRKVRAPKHCNLPETQPQDASGYLSE
jgi:hypothetical protein